MGEVHGCKVSPSFCATLARPTHSAVPIPNGAYLCCTASRPPYWAFAAADTSPNPKKCDTLPASGAMSCDGSSLLAAFRPTG